MSQRIKTANTRKRRGFTLLWIAGIVIVLGSLLWFEQIALLYVLATLGLTVLMVIVAKADIGTSTQEADGSISGREMPATVSSRSARK